MGCLFATLFYSHVEIPQAVSVWIEERCHRWRNSEEVSQNSIGSQSYEGSREQLQKWPLNLAYCYCRYHVKTWVTLWLSQKRCITAACLSSTASLFVRPSRLRASLDIFRLHLSNHLKCLRLSKKESCYLIKSVPFYGERTSDTINLFNLASKTRNQTKQKLGIKELRLENRWL